MQPRPPKPISGGQETVLIVDDNLTNLQVLFTTLSSAGYHVVPAQGAASAFARLKHTLPDLILLDIMMPEMDGFALYQRLRTEPATLHTPVIFISAMDDHASIVRGFELGAVDYVTKPFHAEEVIARVNRQMAFHRLQQTLKRELEQRRALEHSLREAKTQAEQANRAKSTFLANMSHDLRTPLNSVLGYTQILRRAQNLHEEQTKLVDAILHAGQYLLTLLNDILDLSRIEAGRFELLPTPSLPRQLFDELDELFRTQARGKGLDFSLRGVEQLPGSVEVDERRLRQILINLLGNAIKFTQHGRVSLEVGYRAGQLTAKVEDSGRGIPAEQLDTIFIPFSQLGANTQKREGSGLGLSICKALVEQMGGTLTVHSVAGEGSCFEFSIPAPTLQTHRPDLDPALEGAVGYLRTDGQTTPLRLLVADDNADNRDILLGLLTPLGFELETARDGEEALTKLTRNPADLVLMDIVMPHVDGLEATRRLRISHPGLPVVAVSARAYSEDRRASANAGCVAHLNKPIDYLQLLQSLGAHLPLTWLLPEPPPMPDAATAGDPHANDRQELAHLSPALRRQLRSSILHGQASAIRQSIGQLSAEAPELAQHLRRWVEEYQYQRILDLLDQADETGQLE